MRRWVFHILAFCSFALCVATLVLWMMAYSRVFWVYRIALKTTRSLKVTSAGLEFWESVLFGESHNGAGGGSRFGDGFYSGPSNSLATFVYNNPSWAGRGFRFAGLWYVEGDDRSSWSSVPFGRSRVLLVPFWLPAITSSMMPAMWLRVVRRRRRQKQWQAANRCQQCGYDLRASKGRCPECGSTIAMNGALTSARI